MKLKLKDVYDLITVRLALEFWEKETSIAGKDDEVMDEEGRIARRLVKQCLKKERKNELRKRSLGN